MTAFTVRPTAGHLIAKTMASASSDPSGWWAVALAAAAVVISVGALWVSYQDHRLGGPIVSSHAAGIIARLTLTSSAGDQSSSATGTLTVTVRNGGRGDVSLDTLYLRPALSFRPRRVRRRWF
jgi:hypothetical protein